MSRKTWKDAIPELRRQLMIAQGKTRDEAEGEILDIVRRLFAGELPREPRGYWDDGRFMADFPTCVHYVLYMGRIDLDDQVAQESAYEAFRKAFRNQPA